MEEICIINNSSTASTYGIGTYINEYIICLKRLGFKINLIILENTIGNIIIKDDNNIRTIIIPFLNLKKIHTYNKAIAHLLRLYLTDSENLIFHFNYTYHNTLIEGIKTYFPLSSTIFTIHYLGWSSELNGNSVLFKEIVSKSKDHDTIKKYGDILEKYKEEKSMLESVDAVVCLSEDTLGLLSTSYLINPDKLFLIPNGLSKKMSISPPRPKKELRKKYGIPSKEKILLFVGRINEIKGIFPLISCFTKVIKEFPDCRLVLIGDGDIDVALKYCKNIWTKVTFTGLLEKEDVHNWYQIADIALFTSYYEECSYVGIEMMSYGLPVISSDGYSVKNMFEQNAMITPIGDKDNPEEFENRLLENILALLKSRRLQEDLSLKSEEVFDKVYGIDNMAEGYKKLFSYLSKQ